MTSPLVREAAGVPANSCPHTLQRGGLPARLITGRTSLWQWLHHIKGHLLESIPGRLTGAAGTGPVPGPQPQRCSGGGAVECEAELWRRGGLPQDRLIQGQIDSLQSLSFFPPARPWQSVTPLRELSWVARIGPLGVSQSPDDVRIN